MKTIKPKPENKVLKGAVKDMNKPVTQQVTIYLPVNILKEIKIAAVKNNTTMSALMTKLASDFIGLKS